MTFLSDLGIACGAIGVTMSAAGSVLLDVMPPFAYKVFLAVQTAVIALGVYATAQAVKPVLAAVNKAVS